MKRYNLQPPSNELELPLYVGSMYPHEMEIINDRHQFIVVVAHRRARKTTTLINKCLLEAITGGKGMYFVVYPTATMARDILWRDPNQLWRIIPKQLIKNVREVEMNIDLVNGATIAIRGSDDKDRLVGTSGRFYGLDEFEIMESAVFDQVIYPVVKQNGGSVYISGTPRGKNHLHKAFLRGNDPNYPDWTSFFYPVVKTRVFSEEQLETMKSEMGSRLFAQEMLCDFLDSSGVIFRGVQAVATLNPQESLEGHLYICGVDLARLEDFTAVTVFDSVNNNMVYLERIKDLDWTFQSLKIKAIADKYNHALCVVEANNVGDVIVDMLLRSGVSVEPYKTTAPSKKEMVERLSLYIESKKIRLLNDPTLINELESFGYEITPLGNVRYQATTAHDDLVISTALAVTKLYPLVSKDSLEKKELNRIQYTRQQAELNSDPAYQESKFFDEWSEI